MPVTKVGLLANSTKIRARIRRDAERLLTEKANQAVAYAANLAEASLHTDRPGRRRNLTKGHKRYIESFVVWTSINDRSRVRVELTNTSPVAHIIEAGSRPHVILPVRRSVLRMPFPTAEGSFSGKQQGTFATDGPPWQYAQWVRHPGGRSFQILGRTAKAVRSGQVGRGTGIRSG